MGKIAYFQNDYPKAKEYFQKAYDILPIAQYLIDLSDMASREGNISLSNQLLTLAELSFVSSSKTDEDNDLEFSSFLLEHDMQKELALEKALRAYESRPNIFAADNLAWAYYKNDRIDDALSLREKAFLL